MNFAGPDGAIYEVDGETFHPTELSQGPWDPNRHAEASVRVDTR